ncbi:MAG: thioredoxin domain-containing protein [Gaiellaceae bacterium]
MKRDDLVRILAVVGGAIVLVVALVVAVRLGHHTNKPSASNIQLDSVNEMLSGIPQKGITLGSPKAKLTLVEFADPQCPACGDFSRSTFPSLVQGFVRTGKLRIEYRGLDFVGGDSVRLLRLAQAAGLQNKLWNVVELEYENQGSENSGYATDSLLRGLANAVPELDVNKVMATWNTNVVVPNMDAAQKLADQSFKKLYTPSFLLGPTGAKPTKTIVGDQPLQDFVDAINAELKK